jgi:hypothetical protein
MLGNIFTQSFFVQGTLAADVNIRYKAAIACKLIHVSAVGSNSNSAVLVIGDGSDNDAYLTAVNVGDSDVPAEFDRDDFVDTQYPRITKASTVAVFVDYDGSGGTAVHDLTLVLTFLEG